MSIALNVGSGGKTLKTLTASGEETQYVSQPNQTSVSSNYFSLTNTTSRSVSCTTTTGSYVITSSALFLSTDLGRAITGTGIPANAIITKYTSTSSVTFSTPQSSTYPYGQAATASGGITSTVYEGFAGTYELTRSIGVVRILSVLGSYVADGTAFSTTLGGTFVFQFSEDGTTATITEVRSITDFATVRDFDLINAGAYFRVMYSPNRVITSSETVFGVTTFRSHFDGAFVRLADQQIEKSNALMTQQFAYSKGFKPNGKSADVLMNPEAQLIGGDYKLEVSRNSITGASSVRVEARNTAVSTTEQLIWEGGAAFNFLTSAATVRVKVGGNANDTAAGSGARQMTVVGLDAAGAVISETIATAGASASAATSQSFIRVNDVYVSQAGTYATGAIATGSNTGAISVETSGGTLLALIAANVGRGGRAIYSVPAGFYGYFRRVRVTPEGSKNVTFRVWTRKLLTTTSAPFGTKMIRAEWTLISAAEGFTLEHPFRMDPLEEIWVSAKTGTGASAAAAAFEIQLVAV